MIAYDTCTGILNWALLVFGRDPVEIDNLLNVFILNGGNIPGKLQFQNKLEGQ